MWVGGQGARSGLDPVDRHSVDEQTSLHPGCQPPVRSKEAIFRGFSPREVAIAANQLAFVGRFGCARGALRRASARARAHFPSRRDWVVLAREFRQTGAIDRGQRPQASILVGQERFGYRPRDSYRWIIPSDTNLMLRGIRSGALVGKHR